MKKLVEELNKKGVFVRELESHDIPYHSEYLVTSAKRMTDEITKYLPKPKLRSKKWMSTAVLDSECEDILRYASAEYFVHNLISPVYFYNKLKTLQTDAIILEIGPHALFSKIITQTLESSTYLSLIKKDANETNLDMFLSSLAKLYEFGLNPTIENLYPKVKWPVARGTQSISSLIQWDHKQTYFVRKFPDYHFRATASDMNEVIDLQRAIKSFLPDHSIDGNVLFPATGYMMLAWRQLAAFHGKIWNQMPVVFEDVQFRRPVFLSDNDVTRMKVRYFQHSGN
jgi:fatty acid synthase